MIYPQFGARLWALRSLIAATLLVVLSPAAAEPAPSDSAGPAPSASSDAPAPRRRVKESAAAEDEEAAGDEQTPEEAVQSGAGLVNQAHAALRTLQAIRQRARIEPELDQLRDHVLKRRDALRERLQEARAKVHRARRAAWIRDVRFSFLGDRRLLDGWEERVTEENERLTSGKKRTQKLLDFWLRAQDVAKQTNAPEGIREQTDRVVEAARATERALAEPLAVMIPLQSTLTETRDMVDSFLQATGREGPNLLKDAHVTDFTVSTAVKGLGELKSVGSAAKTSLAHMRDMGRRFPTSAREEVAAQLLFTLLAVLGMFRLRLQARGWQEDEQREGRIARRIVDHPFASALQIGTVAGLALYEEMPTVVAIALYLVAVSSALVLFLGLLTPPLRRLIYIAGAFLFVDLARIVFAELAYVERLLLLGELVVFALLLARLLRKSYWQNLGLPGTWSVLLRFVVWVWLLGSGVGALAGAAGYGYLADIAGAGMLRSMYLALVYAGLVEASASVLWIVTQNAPAKKINFIRDHRMLVVQRVSRLYVWIGVAVWAKGTLDYLTLKDVFVKASKDLLGTPLEMGALSISLGDVLALVLGTGLAMYVARLLRFVLDQDLLGRLSMAPGTREVAGSGIYWAALLIGFFTALAAAGIGLERLTVLAGAIGVGVGFGLQNVVQNFVGGLILLFGRFIKVGDKIQLADLMGEVRSVGFRASTVRTWQGAEVIVPNSNLISDQVINWTLSDQKRRIELKIGVGYGTDPERVLALLRDVGQSNEKVLDEPPVVALFINHGDSTLDFELRAWVTFDDFAPVSSELTLALNKRLVSEGIEIPFPQRDVNLRAIAPEVAEALSPRASPPR